MMRTFLALAALLAAALPAHAQVYKCVEGARTVYSQIPCPADASSTTIRRTAPSAPAPGTAKSGGPQTAAAQEPAFRKRQQEAQKAQKKDDEKTAQAREKEDHCNSARSQLAQYEQGGRIARFNDKGERYLLDDAQIEQEKGRAQALVDQWCR
jgi:hypothetical protein